MPSPLRVVVLDHTAELGDVEFGFVRLLAALPPDEFEVTTLLFSDGPLADLLRTAGHRVLVVPLERSARGRQGLETPPAARALRAAAVSTPFLVKVTGRIARIRPDAIHTLSLPAHLVGMSVAAVTRTPLVWHIQDRISADRLPRRSVTVFRALARRVPTEVITNSYATAATLEPIPHLTVAHPGCTPDQAGNPIGIHVLSKPSVIGLLADIAPDMGQLEFVLAAATVLESHPDVEFRILGSASGQEEYEQQVREAITERGLGDHIRMTGPTGDPARSIDEMSLLVQPRTSPLPFDQVVVEAMFRGVPVVATGGGAAQEILDPEPDGELLGLLVPPGDVAALAQAIRTVLDHPEDAAERAARAWRSAHDRFSIQRTADVVGEVWHRAARAHPTRDGG